MTIPYLTQASAPAEEPVTLSETKLYLRVDHSNEDTLIGDLITAARQQAESYMRCSIITQSWTLHFDDYAPSSVELLRGPVQSITSVKTIARDGTETTVDSNTYYLNAGKTRLEFDATPISHAVEIEYVVGFGDASATPPAIKQAVLTHIAQLYDKRGEDLALAPATRGLLDNYRVLKI